MPRKPATQRQIRGDQGKFRGTPVTTHVARAVHASMRLWPVLLRRNTFAIEQRNIWQTAKCHARAGEAYRRVRTAFRRVLCRDRVIVTTVLAVILGAITLLVHR